MQLMGNEITSTFIDVKKIVVEKTIQNLETAIHHQPNQPNDLIILQFG